ncbi:MAG: selenocysteine-specific translation elongation factor SelB [Acidobacteria bacterium OLB17]|nr:MAG: selenocysteine-specific translation elongation factor SelB [Acidobacteria bacterium OLB17]MCZ2390487.1 selenocysteine-specific translation elongation factor [Acidobacteriota bacterium]
MSVVIGTAGHIDHGKTTLVKALTGVDTDRLPDEKRRGITIDIGFAELRSANGNISFIDVPGHERFVRNMLAGASGIDVVMLVVAADDGVMPQTREHFEICRLLGVEEGVIAITKASLVESEMIDLVRADIAELVAGAFLENAWVFVTDAQEARGIDALRGHLLTFTRDRTTRARKSFRLPIDRVFSRKGFGTIVTGTVAAGSIAEGSEAEIYPLGVTARVRGLQNHDRDIDTASAGMRVAMNLAGVERHELARGLVVGEAGAFRPSNVFDAEVEVCRGAKPLADRQRVRVHVGTKELMARVSLFDATKEIAPGEKGLARLRLEGRTLLVAGEHFIIRSYSPVDTIAGGIILDPHAGTRGSKRAAGFLSEVRDALGDMPKLLLTLIASADRRGVSPEDLAAFSGDRRADITAALDKLVGTGEIVKCGSLFASGSAVKQIEANILEQLKKDHAAEPLARGFRPDDLRRKVSLGAFADVFRECVSRLTEKGSISADGELIRLATEGVSMSDAERRFSAAFLKTLEDAGLEVPRQAELAAELASREKISRQSGDKLVRLLVSDGKIAKVSDEFYFSRAALDRLVEQVRSMGTREIDVPKFKDIAGVSRKYAIPLLEYFDREKVTARRKDGSRVLI